MGLARVFGEGVLWAAALCAMSPVLQAQGLVMVREVLRATRRYGRLLQDVDA